MHIDINSIRQTLQLLDESIANLTKQAFAPAPPPPPAGGDPNAMPPPPPGDPNAMPPPPPGDPNAMPPPPPGDPNAGGGGGAMPPELEQILNDMAGGVTQVAQTVEQQQSSIEQLGARQLEIEKKLEEFMNMMNGPAPFEGSTKSPASLEEEAGANAAQGQELPLG